MGFDDAGKLLGVDIKMYEAQGYLPNEQAVEHYFNYADNSKMWDLIH